MTIDITALFCCLDDFCRLYEKRASRNLLPLSGQRRRAGKLCLSEMMFIMALFHVSPFKHFKAFYIYGVQDKYRDCFRQLPSETAKRRRCCSKLPAGSTWKRCGRLPRPVSIALASGH